MNSRKHAAHPTVSCFGGTKQPTNSGVNEEIAEPHGLHPEWLGLRMLQASVAIQAMGL
jgi:hypothetical protein